MCGGAVGEAIGGIDKFLTKMDPIGQGISHWEHKNILKPLSPALARFADKVQAHPVEDAAAVLAAYYGYGLYGAAGGGAEAGAAAGAGAAGEAGAGAGLTSADAAALYGDAGYGAASAGDVAAGAGAAGAAGDYTTGIAAEAPGGPIGTGSADQALGDYIASGGAGDVATADPGFWGRLGSYASKYKSALGGSKGSLGVAQVLSGLYGMEQSRKYQRQTQAPDPSKLTSMPGYQAGLEAVMRSMAAQGYQGSGNMMAALQKYGGDAYSQMWGNQIAAAQAGAGMTGGTMSSAGLVAAGLSGMFGG